MIICTLCRYLLVHMCMCMYSVYVCGSACRAVSEMWFFLGGKGGSQRNKATGRKGKEEGW